MAHLSLRIDDDIAEAVGVLSKAAGMSRSAWIARAIKDALEARPDEIRDVPTSNEGGSKALHFRLHTEEVAAIDYVAEQAGLSRTQWVKRTLRWQLWTRAGELRLVPSSYRSIMKIVGQVRKIGYSLNQAVKAMNAANRPESPLIIERVAGDVLEMEERLSATIKEADAELTAIVSGEVNYWTGRERKPASLIEIEP